MVADARVSPEPLLARCHPLTPLAVAAVLAVAGLAFDAVAALGVLLVCALGLAALARVRPRPALVLGAGVSAALLWAIGRWCGSPQALTAVLRLLLLLVMAAALSTAVRIQVLARVLGRWRCTAAAAVAALLALRAVPALAGDLAAVRRAARLRGPAGPLAATRLGATRTVVLPALVSLCAQADRLGLALELRGFVPGTRRGAWRTPRFSLADGAVLVLTALALVAAGVVA